MLAYDEVTGAVGAYPVTDTLSHTDAEIVYLVIDGEEIETTRDHPFYTDDGLWIEAAALEPGEQIYSLDGDYGTVETVAIVSQPQAMYNLTVDDAHTFFVGDGAWLVHNIPICVWTRNIPTQADKFSMVTYRFPDLKMNQLLYIGEGRLSRYFDHIRAGRTQLGVPEYFVLNPNWVNILPIPSIARNREGQLLPDQALKFLTQVAERAQMFNYTLPSNAGRSAIDWNVSMLANDKWQLQNPRGLAALREFFSFTPALNPIAPLNIVRPPEWPEEFTPLDRRFFYELGRQR